MHRSRLFLALASLAALSWIQSPSASGPEAETAKVDAWHSSVLFRVRIFNSSNFYGRFNKVSGEIVTREGGVGSLDVSVDAASVDTSIPARNKHLKSPDFFNVKQFPTIGFQSEKVKSLGENRYEAEGTFSMHGVSRPLTVTFTRIGHGKGKNGEARTGFEGSFTIKRSDFGMKFMVGPLSDEVTMIISLSAIVQ